MLSEAGKEIEIATSKMTTMFLIFKESEPQRSYKKRKVYQDWPIKYQDWPIGSDPMPAR